jgi:intracellular multiplication protein IcmX
MKLLSRYALPSVLFFAASSTFASAEGTTNDSMNELTTYLLNLGAYFGYSLQNSPSITDANGNQQPIAISQNLLFNQGATAQLNENYVFNSYLGALLVNTAVPNATQFVSTSGSTNNPYTPINAFANYTFTTPPYSSPAQDTVSVSPLIDQPPYQTDPVSQAILNILGTPDFSYCLNNDGTAVVSCTYPSGTLNNYQVQSNTIGTLPTTQNYFTYAQTQPLLSELNVNSLIAPLLYSQQSNTGTGSPSSAGASPTVSGSTNQGLIATSQEQQAANFIRFATGAVSPLPLPNRSDYDNLLLKAQNTSKTYSATEQAIAQATLTSYLNSVRIFAAQSSVGIANLYYMLSKRLPQSQSTNNSGQQTSQALSEFAMATWRLYNPDLTSNTQWVTQINNASAATVQKEMAVLLAEINYQLYLSRQQQERLLLTNTMLLIQNARASQPSPTFTPPAAAAAAGTSGTNTGQ